MGLKFFAIACIALFSIQGLAQAKSVADVEERGVVADELQKIVEQLHEAIEDAVNAALVQVKDASAAIAEIAQAEIEKLVSGVESTIEEAMKEVTELAEQVHHIRGDVKECHMEQAEAIKAVAVKAKADLRKCAADLKALLEEVNSEAIALIKQTRENLKALVQELKACSDNSCRIAVAKKAVAEIRKANKAIAEIIRNSSAEVRAAAKAAVQCGKGVLKNIKAELKPIADKIRECINSKIGTQ